MTDPPTAPPPQTPRKAVPALPYVHRRQFISGGVFVGVMAVWVIAVALVTLTGRGPAGVSGLSVASRAARYAFAPPIALAIALYITNARWQSRVRQLAANTDYRLCPRCCYDLTRAPPRPESPETVRCPECGDSVHAAEAQRQWRAWAGQPATDA